jgi:hypothetical protein
MYLRLGAGRRREKYSPLQLARRWKLRLGRLDSARTLARRWVCPETIALGQALHGVHIGSDSRP